MTSRIDGNIVSRGTAIVRAPKSAFVYPGQGIQKQGMVLDERAKSPAAREVWERADKVTREKLGFSILAVVRDNPKELTANGVTYRHPEGLLNLTQFTQVALATVAFAQTARLREAGADILLRRPLAGRVQRAELLRRRDSAGNRAGAGVPPWLHHAPPHSA